MHNRLSRRQFLGVTATATFTLAFRECGRADLAKTQTGYTVFNNVSNTYFFTYKDCPMLNSLGGILQVGVNATSGYKMISCVRTAETVANTVQMGCTLPGGGYMDPYNLTVPGYLCGIHHCRFAVNGAVLVGPATQPLPSFVTVVGAQGITITIP